MSRCRPSERPSRALAAGDRGITLDHMLVAGVEQVVKPRAGRARASRIVLEPSGPLRLDTVRTIAGTVFDLIPVGALTHSAPLQDVTLLLTTGAVSCPR
ncbi:hypothetical protein [Streptomyces sp. NPDC001743]|uniref:hypothetical protein n=1 Tax=Streptomyces sp. NPDC001743 TaxID=3154397 RepID=UPI003325F4FD